jgi:hypothetical protein
MPRKLAISTKVRQIREVDVVRGGPADQGEFDEEHEEARRDESDAQPYPPVDGLARAPRNRGKRRLPTPQRRTLIRLRVQSGLRFA